MQNNWIFRRKRWHISPAIVGGRNTRHVVRPPGEESQIADDIICVCIVQNLLSVAFEFSVDPQSACRRTEKEIAGKFWARKCDSGIFNEQFSGKSKLAPIELSNKRQLSLPVITTCTRPASSPSINRSCFLSNTRVERLSSMSFTDSISINLKILTTVSSASNLEPGPL